MLFERLMNNNKSLYKTICILGKGVENGTITTFLSNVTTYKADDEKAANIPFLVVPF